MYVFSRFLSVSMSSLVFTNEMKLPDRQSFSSDREKIGTNSWSPPPSFLLPPPLQPPFLAKQKYFRGII